MEEKLIIPLYCIFSLPGFIITDIYLYTIKLFSNLAATKYLYNYYKLKTTVEGIFESIPQIILLLFMLFFNDKKLVSLSLLMFAIITSLLSITIQLLSIHFSAQSCDEGFWSYIWNVKYSHKTKLQCLRQLVHMYRLYTMCKIKTNKNK